MIFLSTLIQAQIESQYYDREYGIGIASVISPYQVPLYFFEQPSTSSQKISYFNYDTLIFYKTKDTVRSFDQMIEISYEEIGFPILGYSGDSQWVKLSLNCKKNKVPTIGWIKKNTHNIIFRSWTQILSKAHRLFFIKKKLRLFYSDSANTIPVNPKIYSCKSDSTPNYYMERKSIKGRWMLVELESPSAFCRTDADVLEEYGTLPKKYLVWIEFLDEQMRPLIFYPTRGC